MDEEQGRPPTEIESVDHNTLIAPKRKRNKRWLWLVLILIILLVATAWWYFGYFKHTAETAEPSDVSQVDQAAVTTEDATTNQTTNQNSETVIQDTDITWLTKPVKIADQHLFTISDNTSDQVDQTIEAVKYYQVADTADGGQLVGVYLAPAGPMIDYYVLLKQAADGSWTYYSKHSDDLSSSGYASDAKFNYSEAVIRSLDNPNLITAGPVSFIVITSLNSNLVNDYDSNNLTQVATSAYGTIWSYYQASSEAEATPKGLASETLFLRRNDGRMLTLKIEIPFIRDDHTLKLSVNGQAVSGSYTDEGMHSCGSTAQSLVAQDETLIADKTEFAKADDGTVVYALNKDSSLMKSFYNEYAANRDYPGAEPAVSYDSYLASKPVLVWQDGIGRWLVLKNEQFAPLAECGKPVIYLYPEKTTPVSVKVGARLTVSVPDYGSGWQVVAKPGGQIVSNGQIYPYLFWEGFGQGSYPANVDWVGVVVPQDQVVPTIYRQMGELGLTNKEQADFMDFWRDRLPSTPYTRLTWLTTREMNALAPLEINPEPDTLIRVFLDFAGLKKYQTLTPQVLKPVPRQGFTVVEWGGLLKR